MRDDQARGLRRLFVRQHARMIGVVGEDASGLALELAQAYARLSQRVLLLDRTCGEAARGLGLRARFELKHALTGDKALHEVALEGPQDIVLLPAARALELMSGEGGAACEGLCASLDAALGPFDVMLVNGAPLPVPHAGVLLALAPTSTALTHAYTELKRFSRAGAPRRWDVVIHKARSEAAALDAFDSVALTAGRFLGMTLALAGTLPAAPHGAGANSARGRAAERIAQRLTAEPLHARKAVNH
jgi:MinD-like ATPase involved in chromosome partitioning or flagellar assembly